MRRLPDLGPHGEGWFAIQLVLFAAVWAAAGLGPAWGGWPRLAGAILGGLLAAAGAGLAIRGLVDLRRN
jgi:hypothetical protein